VEAVRSQAAAAHRAASAAVDAVNKSSTHLQSFVSARRRELDALESFRAAVGPLTDAAASPTPVTAVRRVDEVTARPMSEGEPAEEARID
jgi:DNA recombination protein RmuC